MSSVATVLPTSKSRRRRWIGAALAAVLFSPATLLLPPIWQGAVRAALAWEASRHGYGLTIDQVHGGPFGATQLDAVQVWSTNGDTRLSVARASFRLSVGASWLESVRMENVRGTLDLASGAPESTALRRRFAGPSASWQPANFSFQADDLRLQRGRDAARFLGLLVTGEHRRPGTFEVHEVRAEGPGFAHALLGGRGRTFWKDGCLTFSSVLARDGATAANGTLDFSRLGRGLVKWEGNLHLLGGELRGQGAFDLAHADAPLEIAATVQRTSLAPLARLLGVRGPTDGEVEQASFTFRGDPADLSAAQMSLSGRATGFRWEDCRWQSLEVQAVVVHRRVQLNRFDLRQDGNRLAVSGECALPPLDATALRWAGEGSWWQAAGFTGNIDARLEDLGALAKLVGRNAPELRGRMSINGQLSAAGGSADVAGYLNVEGTRLSVRGAPLDYLHSTLLFRRGAMEIADVQATQDTDYFAAHGVVGLSGDHATRTGELRAEVRDASVYLPALAAWPEVAGRIAPVRQLEAVVRVEKGELIFDRWEGEATERLLAQ